MRSLVHPGLSAASARALAIVDAMILACGPIGSAWSVGRRLGFRSRFEFARWLARQGVPPLHELAGWISVLVWLDRCERSGTSLCTLALRRGRDPAACYRLVQRVTGLTWSTVQALGLAWVAAAFRARCGRLAARRHLPRWRRREAALDDRADA